jgi:hypothetical protein
MRGSDKEQAAGIRYDTMEAAATAAENNFVVDDLLALLFLIMEKNILAFTFTSECLGLDKIRQGLSPVLRYRINTKTPTTFSLFG